MKHKAWILPMVIFVALLLPTLALAAAPGRPVIQEGTIYTAWNTKIRGLNIEVYNLSETGEPGMVPTYEDIAAIKENGMNCVKITVFGPDLDPDWLSGGPLYENNTKFTDMIVDWTEEIGIYCIICLQTQGDPISEDFVCDFWRLYAPRYADRTHVFYDLANEMSVYPEGDDTHLNTPALEAKAYGIIRENAPDTLCIFWSFSHLMDMESSLRVIRQTEALVPGGIPWTNEAVAFHAYEGTNGYTPEDNWVHLEVFRSEIRDLKAAGYPLFNTEVPNTQFGYRNVLDLANYPNTGLLQVLEDEHIGWTCSLNIAWMQEPSIWKGNVERAKLDWTPDFGTWPAPGLIDPYLPHAALAGAAEATEAYESMGEAESLEELGNEDLNRIPCYYVNADSAIRYADLNFGTLEPLSLTIRARGFDDGVTVIAHEGGADGPILCEIPIRKTPGENAEYTAPLLRGISGISDVTFTFRDREDANNFALMYFIDWRFNLPPVLSDTVHTDLYAGPVAAAGYNFRQGDVLRLPSTDVKAKTEMGRELMVGGITDGSAILFDRVPFTPDETVFEIRARSLAGGRVDVYANWGFEIRPWTYWTFPLGSCEIAGDGRWNTYAYTIEPWLLDNVVYNQFPIHTLDLVLVFHAEDGSADKELFEISEFSFIQK